MRRRSSVCTAGASNAAGQIELARARVGAAPAYRKRGVDVVSVPRADIEVDVDMENTNDGCYLWGALVTDRRNGAPTVRYMPFVTWDPDIEAGELIAFKDFWSWFSDLRAEASGEGASFKAYCYSKSAEQGQMTADRRPSRRARRGRRVLGLRRLGRPARGRQGAADHGPQHGVEGDGPAGRFRVARPETAGARWPWSSTTRRSTKRRGLPDALQRKSGSSSTTRTTCGRRPPCANGSMGRRGTCRQFDSPLG